MKEDMGEVLHVVDFDQLKIENQQYLERIEERNNELLRLKTMTGKAVQVSVQAGTPRAISVPCMGSVEGLWLFWGVDFQRAALLTSRRRALQGPLEGM